MKKVLIIEDSKPLRNDIIEMLSLEGYQTLSAENGLSGIELAKAEQPDVIVCDIRMPVMDGYTVLNHLRENEQTSTIPFIFLTARTERNEIREGMERGADDYLTKPFTAQELISSVNTRLVRHDSAQKETERQLNTLRNNILIALPHEMRTPLNIILGYSEILATDANKLEREKIHEMSMHINEAGKRLYRMVENYVIYTNLELMRTDQERASQFRQGRTDYAEMIILQEAQEQALAYDREADLELAIDNNFSKAVAMEGENLARVIREVTDNAFKFSQRGQIVRITLTEKKKSVYIAVKDHGRGMTKKEIEAVGPYMQFDRSHKEQQGVGFGLAIALRIVEIHGGHFSITSKPNMCTTIGIELPLLHQSNTH